MPHDALATAQVTLTSTATRIVAGDSDRAGVLIVRHGDQPAYLGSSSAVTTSTGMLFAGTCGAFVSLPTTAEVWGILTGGSLVVSALTITDR